MNRVIVVGGGIVGASAAYYLARDGVDVILIDREDVGHATAAGAGIISPASSLRPLPPFYALGALAARDYPVLIDHLAADGQTDSQFAVVGKLFIAQTGAERARLDDVYALFTQRVADGMPGLEGISFVDELTARTMFPLLGPIEAAIHIPQAARVDGNYLRRALIAGARKHGANIMAGSANIAIGDARHVAVSVDDDLFEADRLVLAGGAWTNSLLASRGLHLALEPQRGQIVHVTMDGEDTSDWPILAGFHDQYVVSFGPHRVVIGATRETGSGYDTRTTIAGVQSVFAHALQFAPGLAAGSIGEIRVGLRPLSADGLPFIGTMPDDDRIVIATGHGPSGLQLGPYSGKIAANLAIGTAVEADLRPFAVDRQIG